jgi:hypothetical protein
VAVGGDQLAQCGVSRLWGVVVAENAELTEGIGTAAVRVAQREQLPVGNAELAAQAGDRGDDHGQGLGLAVRAAARARRPAALGHADRDGGGYPGRRELRAVRGQRPGRRPGQLGGGGRPRAEPAGVQRQPGEVESGGERGAVALRHPRPERVPVPRIDRVPRGREAEGRARPRRALGLRRGENPVDQRLQGVGVGAVRRERDARQVRLVGDPDRAHRGPVPPDRLLDERAPPVDVTAAVMKAQRQVNQAPQASELGDLIQRGSRCPLEHDVHPQQQRRPVAGQARQRRADPAEVVRRSRHHPARPADRPERVDAKHQGLRFRPGSVCHGNETSAQCR